MINIVKMKILSLSGLICIYTAAAVITPRRDLYICPLETVTFSCMIYREQSSFLRWTINFMHQSIEQIETTFIRGSDLLRINHTKTNNIQQSITFMLISTSPNMNSSMSVMIKENPEFSRVLVNCNNGSATTSKLEMSTIHIITQVPVLDSNVTLSVEDYLENKAVVQVNWKQSLFSANNYSVHLSTIGQSNVTVTNNSSIRLWVSYNNEYNFSLVANNCKGSSTQFSTAIMVCHCNRPMVNSNAIVEGYINGKEGSEITIHCRFGQEHSESIISTCVSGGLWSPDPAEFACEEQSCGVPAVQKDVIMTDLNETFNIGSVVSYTCRVNNTHFDEATSVCTEESKWSPDPLNFTCKNSQNTKDNAGLSQLKLIAVIVPGVTIMVIIVLISFTITFKLCTRKSRKSKGDKCVQAINPIEVVYDEIQCYASVPGPKDPTDQVVLKENAAYGELSM